MGGMSLAELIIDLKALLMKAAERFEGEAEDGAFKRHLDMAAADLARFAPEHVLGELTIEGCESLYDAPDDLLRPVRLLWGERERNLPAWDPCFPGRLPTLTTIISGGVRKLQLSPAPSHQLVATLGAVAKYRYVRRYAIADAAADTTVPERLRHVLLTLAASFSMTELANRGSFEPVKIGDGFGSTAKNGTPAALAVQLRESAEHMACA